MFDIGTALASGSTLISAYGKNRFTIGGVEYSGSLFISGQAVLSISLANVSGMNSERIAEILAGVDPAPEILLVGTGQRHEFLPPSLRNELKQRYALSMDSMDTGAACRTFNILASEGRSVAALLLAL